MSPRSRAWRLAGLHLKYRPLTSRTSPAENEPVRPVPCYPARTSPGTTLSASSCARLGSGSVKTGVPLLGSTLHTTVDPSRPPSPKTETMRRTHARSPRSPNGQPRSLPC